jgi:rifampicin phosphotransferase
MSATLARPLSIPDATGLVLPLRDATPETLVGGKAANLQRAIAHGVRVPDGVVITMQALEEHLHENGLRQRIEAATRAVVAAPPHQRSHVARDAHERIRTLLATAPLSERLRGTVVAAATPLLAQGVVVVRSSAVGEDGAGQSYAGQFDSVLHVSTFEALERAVLQCWAGCWSSRAIAYRASHGLRERGMSVIVQRQVDALVSGVLFTRVADADDALIVEYTPGLADRLVAGDIDPGRFVLRGTIVQRSQAPELDDADAERTLFAPSMLLQLSGVAAALERGFGGPQDVEWSLDRGGNLFVVQTRPVTAPLVAPGPTHTAPAEPLVAWSNANINENFPAPISPLLYSIASAGYAHYFRNLARAYGLSPRRMAAMDDALGHIIGAHGARPYYNLTSIHTVLRSAPFGEQLVDAFNRFVGSTGSEGDRRVPPTSALRSFMEVAGMAVRTAWTYRTLGKRVTAFETLADDFAARSHPGQLGRLTLRELRLLLAEFMTIRCHRWTGAALADAASMVCYAALQKLVENARLADSASLHNTLLKAIPNLVSGEPVQRLWALSRMVRQDPALAWLLTREPADALAAMRSNPRFESFRREFDGYIEDWGFRCSAELMLTAPSFQEDPGPVLDTIRAYATIDGESPSEALARQLEEREAETRRVSYMLRGRPLATWLPFVRQHRALRVLLRLTQSAIAYRERARLKQALLYSRCRRIALALGERLVSAGLLTFRDDVFWLTVAELDELAAGTSMFPHDVRALVSLRRRAHARASTMSPADSFTLLEGRYLAVEALSDTGAQVSFGSRAFTGTSACGGRASGPARVLADVREADRLSSGDILVTRQTDPGWAPVFFLIKGLVIERGGMLSHGAIVAREFGIPCVVGVKRATLEIADGRQLAVDGDKGTVHVLD